MQTILQERQPARVSRSVHLAYSFPAAVRMLDGRHSEVDRGMLADYLAFGWLARTDAGLSITPAGARVLREQCGASVSSGAHRRR